MMKKFLIPLCLMLGSTLAYADSTIPGMPKIGEEMTTSLAYCDGTDTALNFFIEYAKDTQPSVLFKDNPTCLTKSDAVIIPDEKTYDVVNFMDVTQMHVLVYKFHFKDTADVGYTVFFYPDSFDGPEL